ncbi:hypothetical protein CYLTODRAFT_424374 [Cylindrobasidium torrendii FP15055 ss-10]|uniref:Uncharacterized protein n=1 Tax=Cylindrobasidium torrendii FP15055 ss-10 TaxID=1314674 RepID=A0A0D7B5C6_9AGAR|nr:hypothetical protein CYLTODRAFT_424374 [Cylindrobasidium torrendii FP15055 ss-10]
MTTTILHRSEDISTYPEFGDIPYYSKLLSRDNLWMSVFEYSAGLHYDEFNDATDCSENHIPVQYRIADRMDTFTFAFIPSDSALEAIKELYEHNNTSEPHCRIPFYTIQHINHCAYTFEVLDDFTLPLYTRHPITGVVTKHIFPYPELPLFTTTAHPCASIVQSYEFLYQNFHHRSRPRTEHPLVETVMKILATWWPSIPQPDVWRAPSPTSSDCPSLTHSSDSTSSEELSEKDCRNTDWAQEVQVLSSDALARVDDRSYANDGPIVRFEEPTMDDGDWRALAVQTRPESQLKAVPKRAQCSRGKLVRPSRIPRRIRSARPIKLQ